MRVTPSTRTRPRACARGLVEFCKNRPDYSSAAAPEMISVSSVVICAWRARLNVRVSCLPIFPALSVAAFIATIRATCSLTTASLNAWNSTALIAAGRISSSSSGPAGLRLVDRLGTAVGLSLGRFGRLEGQQLHDLRHLLARGDKPHVHHVHAVDLARDEAVDEVLREPVHVVVRRLVAELRVVAGHVDAVELVEAHALLADDLDEALAGAPRCGGNAASRSGAPTR